MIRNVSYNLVNYDTTIMNQYYHSNSSYSGRKGIEVEGGEGLQESLLGFKLGMEYMSVDTDAAARRY
jgi:hypothetical protein